MMDIELYGGKSGYIGHVRARALYALGVYRNVRDIDWSAVGRLVFVCKGNICRSPYAAARAHSLGARAISFGLDAADGAFADPVALTNALRRGVNLSGHRSTRLAPSSVAEGDLVIVFEPRHLVEVRRWSMGRTPASLLGIWVQPMHPHIQDPYGRSDRYFQQCFSWIDENVTELVRRMPRGSPSAAGADIAGRFETRERHQSTRDRTFV